MSFSEEYEPFYQDNKQNWLNPKNTQEIKSELESDLKTLKAALILLEDDEKTACFFKIAMGNGRYFEHPIDQNKHLIALLRAEKKFIEKQLNDLPRV